MAGGRREERTNQWDAFEQTPTPLLRLLCGCNRGVLFIFRRIAQHHHQSSASAATSTAIAVAKGIVCAEGSSAAGRPLLYPAALFARHFGGEEGRVGKGVRGRELDDWVDPLLLAVLVGVAIVVVAAVPATAAKLNITPVAAAPRTTDLLGVAVASASGRR